MSFRKDSDESDSCDVEKALRGDDQAFGHLFERHYSRIYGLLYRIAPRESHLYDLTQETFVRAAHRLHQLRGDFRPWLNSVALNLLRDHQRSDSRRRRREHLWAEQHSISAEPNADLGHVGEAVQALPDGLTEVVVLAYYEGHTHSEIAALLDCPEGTVAWRISEAKRILNQSLRKHHAE